MNDWLLRFVFLQDDLPHCCLAVMWVLKSSAIVLLGASAALFLQRRSAAARCWIWRSVLAGLLISLALEYGPSSSRFLLPANYTAEVAMAYPNELEAWHVTRDRKELNDYVASREQASKASLEPPWEDRVGYAPNLAERRAAHWNFIEGALPWIGLGGALLCLLFAFGRSGLGLIWLRRYSRPVGPRVSQWGAATAQEMGVSHAPIIFHSGKVHSPLLVGFFRPTIYLPLAAEEWSEAKLRAVFLHELAHGKRRDFWWLQVGRIATAFFWWNPLVWWAARRMNAEAEEAADDIVVLREQSGEAYARTLVEIAAGETGAKPGIGISMLGFRSLEKRIRRILQENPWRGRVGRAAAMMILAVVAALLVTASVYVGYAAPTGVAAGPAPVELSREQREMLKRVIERTEKRLTALRFAHVQVENLITVEKGGRVFKTASVGKLEAWNDSWAHVFRAEYRPQVLKNSSDDQPFWYRDLTEIHDGKKSYSIELREGLDNVRPGGPGALWTDYLGIWKAKDLLRTVKNILETGVLESSGSFKCIIAKERWQGREALRIERQFFQDGKVSSQSTYVVDPSEEDILLFAEEVNPSADAPEPRQWTVERVGHTADGIPYPEKFQQVDYFEPGVRMVYDFVTTKLERLDALPIGITDLPQKAGARYLAKPGSAVTPEALTIQCTDEGNGKPMPGASLRVRVNKQDGLTLKADAQGKVRILLPREEITFLSAKAAAPGFASRVVAWRKNGDPLQIPDTYQLKLSKGFPIGGKVVDEAGQPVPGATVEMYLNSYPNGEVYYDIYGIAGKAETDEKGRWSMENFPENLDGLDYQISCPGYRSFPDGGVADYRVSSGFSYAALREGAPVFTIRRGSVLKGIVKDEAGNPVRNCRVAVGGDRGLDLPSAETDATGRYAVPGLADGKTWVTVEAVGYRPILEEIVLPFDQSRDFVLAPGKTLRGRVTMPNGKPSAGLNVSAGNWKDRRTLSFGTQTDADGYFVWNGAPDEPVQLCFGACQGREFLSGLWMQAGPEIKQVVMKPALRFSGEVVDAKTDQPISEVRLVPGYGPGPTPGIVLDRASAKTFTGGHFEWQIPDIQYPCCFEIEAKGYKTFRTAPMETNQSEVTQQIRLERE